MAKRRSTSKTRGSRSRAAKKAPTRKVAKASTRTRPRRAAPRASVRPAAKADPMRTLAKRIVDLTVAHDDDASLALYADTVESVEPGMPPMAGIEAIRQKFNMWRGMVSDSTWHARSVCVQGNTIMIEWSGHVTMAGSGRQVDLKEVAVHEIQNGKIVRERFYYDPSVMQQQS